ADRLLRDVHPVGDVCGRATGREEGQRLALARAERRRSAEDGVELVHDVRQPEAPDHPAFGVLQRDRAQSCTYAGSVGARDGYVQLRVGGAVQLLCPRFASARQLPVVEADAAVEPSADVAEDLDGGGL